MRAMRAFDTRDFRAAIAHAVAGGQAIHVHRFIGDRSRAPGCFTKALARGESIGHLFDANEARLVATARRLGVRVVVVQRRGTDRQHVDLCGSPLAKALAACWADDAPAGDVSPCCAAPVRSVKGKAVCERCHRIAEGCCEGGPAS